ncbi:MAG: ChrR family anti-sigma-E factor [Polyangia bacterium]
MPNHHLTDSWLLDYAAGATAEAQGLLVATHLALCAPCRLRVKEYEELGGALLDELPPTPLSPSAGARLQQALRAIETAPDPASAATSPAPSPAVSAPAPAHATRRGPKVFSQPLSVALPGPLRPYVRGSLAELRWRRLKEGLSEAELPLPADGPRTRLLLLQAGATIPRHAHKGTEGVLVLSGGLSDRERHMRRGDVMICDDSVIHENVADPDEDCLSLVVTEGPIRLTGALGGLISLVKKL